MDVNELIIIFTYSMYMINHDVKFHEIFESEPIYINAGDLSGFYKIKQNMKKNILGIFTMKEKEPVQSNFKRFSMTFSTGNTYYNDRCLCHIICIVGDRIKFQITTGDEIMNGQATIMLNGYDQVFDSGYGFIEAVKRGKNKLWNQLYKEKEKQYAYIL
jgi:hypothetical protein